jgi:hypothetical protein
MNESVTNDGVNWLSDFATIFAWRWYRDFPKVPPHREMFQRADATIHIGITVRGAADLMGLFAHFESGGRTDCILRDNSGAAVAGVEWEWQPLDERGDINEAVNEIGKLSGLPDKPKCKGMRFVAFIGYVREENAATAVEQVQRRWTASSPLLLVLVHYRRGPKRRAFTVMTLDQIEGGKDLIHLRRQMAYPWDVKGSRWELANPERS